MSQEAINAQLKKSQDAALKRDYDANRCTILTELHGDKWRVYGMGPRLRNGKIELVTMVREFDKFSLMLADLPRIADSFYSVTASVPEPANVTPMPNGK